jgi:glycosyltransferase involved in cell wall biosynthesis
MKIIRAVFYTICFLVVILFGMALNWTSLTIWPYKKQSGFKKISSHDSLTIFMVTNNYTPYSGGVVTTVNSYAQQLRLQGHKVFIITLDFLGTADSQENDVIRIYSPLKFMYHNNHMAIPWQPTNAIHKLAKKFNPDVIHVFHPFLLGASALRVGTILNIPVVFTYMTLYDQYLHYVPLPKMLTKPVTAFAVNDFCNKVDALIAPSNSAKEYICAQGITKEIDIVPLSILPLFLKSAFKEKPTSKKRFTLLTVSRFTPEKNIFFLLDMYKKLDAHKFRLVLIGYGSQLKELKKYAYKKLELSTNDVTFLISPPKDEIRAWYDRADLFVFASKTDTQGLVLAESMARGTPVVALKAPGVIDIISNGNNGFMVDTADQMADMIKKIAFDSNLFKTLQQNACLRGNQYAPQVCTKKLVEVYKRHITQKAL